MKKRPVILIFIIMLLSIILLIFNNCSEKKKIQEENIYDLEKSNLDLNKIIGKYIFIPTIKEQSGKIFDDYKDFQLEKGDTLVLEIKKDSTFYFNHFYYDSIKKIDNYSGKLNIDIYISIPFPEEAKFAGQGFIISKKNKIYYYSHLKREHYQNYEYKLFYEKVK